MSHVWLINQMLHTHSHEKYQFTFATTMTKKRMVSLTVQYSSQETKTIYKTPQCCEMLTRRGLGAVLKLGQCHFNRWTVL